MARLGANPATLCLLTAALASCETNPPPDAAGQDSQAEAGATDGSSSDRPDASPADGSADATRDALAPDAALDAQAGDGQVGDATSDGPDDARSDHDADSGDPSTCDDGVLNGDESDVDCGGPDCSRCRSGRCEANADCATFVCADGTCEPCLPGSAQADGGLSGTLLTQDDVEALRGWSESELRFPEPEATEGEPLALDLRPLGCLQSVPSLVVEHRALSGLAMLDGLRSLHEVEVKGPHASLEFLRPLLERVPGLTGDLRIVGTEAVDLAGLEPVTSIGGVLWIQDNTALTSLAGLDALEVAHSLWIMNNDALPKLDALDGLVAIIGSIRLYGNAQLSSTGDFGACLSVSEGLSLRSSQNPLLPWCELQTLANRLDTGCRQGVYGSPCADCKCEGNDNDASCLPAEAPTDCPPTTCNDGVRNYYESGVDCGYTFLCPRLCEAGQGCQDGRDCIDGVCEGAMCQPPSCDDGVANGDEIALDCGGSCPDCACNIDGSLYAAGAFNPAEAPCQACVPEQSLYAWTPVYGEGCICEAFSDCSDVFAYNDCEGRPYCIPAETFCWPNDYCSTFTFEQCAGDNYDCFWVAE